MESRILTRILVFLVLITTIGPVKSFAQIKNDLDFSLSFGKNRILNPGAGSFEFPDYQVMLPSVLSHLENSLTWQTGLRYTGKSFRFQPGIDLSHSVYRADSELSSTHSGLKMTVTLINFSYRINMPLKSGRRVNPYFIIGAGYALVDFHSDKTLYTVITPLNGWDAMDPVNLENPEHNKYFHSPDLEVSPGIDIQLLGQLFLRFEARINLVNYPEFYVQNPSVNVIAGGSVGIRYSFFMDKKYLLK